MSLQKTDVEKDQFYAFKSHPSQPGFQRPSSIQDDQESEIISKERLFCLSMGPSVLF